MGKSAGTDVLDGSVSGVDAMHGARCFVVGPSSVHGGQRSLFICFNNNLAISAEIWRTHVCAYQTVHRHRRATRTAECTHCASTPTANRAYSSPRSHL